MTAYRCILNIVDIAISRIIGWLVTTNPIAQFCAKINAISCLFCELLFLRGYGILYLQGGNKKKNKRNPKNLKIGY